MTLGTHLRLAAVDFITSEYHRACEYQSRKVAARYLKHTPVKKLQIGSGSNILSGWLNTDVSPTSNGITFMDASKRFPFEDCAFDYAYSEHFIEHVDYKTGINVIKECFRVLKPAGKIRVTTPDLSFLVHLYNTEKTDLQRMYVKNLMTVFYPDCKTNEYDDAFILNTNLRAWGHRFVYNYKTLSDSLKTCGFIEVKSCHFGESDDPNLQGLEFHDRGLDDDFKKLESMTLEGIKPSS
ncbi:MAG TPA: methyltransferase domain-containing protein [Candidatus Acidoferrales bacterium]|nr:methyltransferase domain-containing protein [Candidatus Acidoferrales bacterium]